MPRVQFTLRRLFIATLLLALFCGVAWWYPPLLFISGFMVVYGGFHLLIALAIVVVVEGVRRIMRCGGR